MKTKDIRKALAESLTAVQEGRMAPEQAKSLIGLANQISQSMAVEVKVAKLKIQLGQESDKFGSLNVAE